MSNEIQRLEQTLLKTKEEVMGTDEFEAARTRCGRVDGMTFENDTSLFTSKDEAYATWISRAKSVRYPDVVPAEPSFGIFGGDF
jgi:hypothetical protein